MPDPLCLLFDCDGTLVDSEPLLAEVMAKYLTQAGLPFHADDYMTDFRGSRFANIVAHLERVHGEIDDALRQRIETAMRAEMHERMTSELEPIDGVVPALEALGSLPRCVASNGPETKIRRALDSTGLRGFFGDNIYSAYTVGSWKPEPGLFLHAGRDMGFVPADCIVIDDAAVGVRAALAAGMRVIHINRFPDRERTPAGAIGIHGMHELPRAVERLMPAVAAANL
ncbi:HAD family hydrolase [Salinicola rhizosphaerae]|uniref:Sugar transferase n=1 Tax=Salinicola rhizosphaerae TaxID=1443141 RepID=A0ABQ3EAZ8_9GAMM|nr:HAD family hydrolase [Salinicola rhizosphaerae]GHB32056.1 sugar transferase [Salinicola rhizosphaerae]